MHLYTTILDVNVKYARMCRERESKLEKIEQSICGLLVSFKAKSMGGTNKLSPEETPEMLRKENESVVGLGKQKRFRYQ